MQFKFVIILPLSKNLVKVFTSRCNLEISSCRAERLEPFVLHPGYSPSLPLVEHQYDVVFPERGRISD
jgi:hypothetical protein